jgi:hypothetical protein
MCPPQLAGCAAFIIADLIATIDVDIGRGQHRAIGHSIEMETQKVEDEINPPLSSTVVLEPAAIIEEIRGEDEEISQVRPMPVDLENGKTETADGSLSSEQQPKIPVLDFPDGGAEAWIMVFGAFLVSFSTFGIFPSEAIHFRICELVWDIRNVLRDSPAAD